MRCASMQHLLPRRAGVVPGRAGMITDVMIDCCGAATGVVLRYLLRSLMCAKKAA